MSPFQWIALPTLACLLLGEIVLRLSGRSHGLAWIVRSCLWLMAGVAIYYPNALTTISKTIGIDRGTNLVLYLLVFAVLAISFYFYARSVRLERQLTQVIRHIAIKEAQHGDQQNDP